MRTAPDPFPKGTLPRHTCPRPPSLSGPCPQTQHCYPGQTLQGPSPSRALIWEPPSSWPAWRANLGSSPHSVRHVYSRNGEQAVEGGRLTPSPSRTTTVPDCSLLVHLTLETSHLLSVTAASAPQGRTARWSERAVWSLLFRRKLMVTVNLSSGSPV